MTAQPTLWYLLPPVTSQTVFRSLWVRQFNIIEDDGFCSGIKKVFDPGGYKAD
jgi:hypothetical protein